MYRKDWMMTISTKRERPAFLDDPKAMGTERHGHGRGHPLARRPAFQSTLYHNDCGGKIDTPLYESVCTCRGCGREWKERHFKVDGGFTDEQLGDRFHYHAQDFEPYGQEEVVMVWKQEGGKMFLGTVSSEEFMTGKYKKYEQQ